MDFMSLVPFLAISMPESMVIYYIALSLVGRKGTPWLLLAASLSTSLFSFVTRTLPLFFGIHTLLQLVLMIVFLILFYNLSWMRSVVSIFLAGILLGTAESLMMPLLSWSFSINLETVIADSVLRILFGLPHLILLTGLTYVGSKYCWKVPWFKKMSKMLGIVLENPKHQPKSHSYLFILYLVQILMLVLLNIGFYNYKVGIYPGFTLDALMLVTSIEILVCAIATIVVALFTMRSVQKEAKLNTQLLYAKERNNQSLKIRTERHDFYNHLTAIYGYLKFGYYTKAQSYIEKIYSSVRNLEEILNIDPPELGALLGIKQEQARVKNIAFDFQVHSSHCSLPFSAEDLTHLIGNLLDNALQAAESSSDPRVEFVLACNRLGVQLKVSNSGDAIPKEIAANIFTPGYTTKNTNVHSGLGLYIIKQIIDSNAGELEIREPENYAGVQFVIFVPFVQ